MGWGSIYRRRLKVFTLALLIYLDYKTAQKRVGWAKRDKAAAIWEKIHQRNAKRVLATIIEMKGLWVKLGQYLSTRADVLPEAYIVQLRQLQDSLPPRPTKEVRRTIQKELGESAEELFSKFVQTPLATASIAQVHRATLKDGQEVVVKVQHEGIKEIILEDLKNAKSIVDWIAWAEPQYDFNPMIDEWCKEAPKELDFNNEAENTRRVYKNLNCGSLTSNADKSGTNHVDVLIPQVIQSTEKILVLEYMDGIRLNDYDSLEEFGVDKQKIVEEITRSYSHQIYVDGFFNGDPHPGNFLVSKARPHRPILLDFGLTKSISNSMKQALAKMFLSTIEGDHVALLSAFEEMGLKLRLDMPDQAMNVTNMIFRSTTPANEAFENMKVMTEQRAKNMKVIQEKLKLNNKEMSRFNPIDAFPGDAVIFFRVLNLLRGLSSSLNVRIVYQEIMRPFAEAALHGSLVPGPAVNSNWINNSKVLSQVESKLRKHLLDMGSDRILGIQVCAYKDGKVIIDTAAGVLGRYDPRPVQPDSLFPVFSATKGITAGMLHWLVDNGKLKLDEIVSNIWPAFNNSGKDTIKVHHILNHTSGLHNAMSVVRSDPMLMADWDEVLNQIALSTPETEPGHEQLYHYLSFGWLCGGIIEHASGKKFQQVLEEAFIYPLNVEGELYIGIPPGVESRLASLTIDIDDLDKISALSSQKDLPASLREANLVEMASGLAVLFNTLNARRAIIPAANGHCSARALARYYASLATGTIPPPHDSNSMPPLGSHHHIPKFSSNKARKVKRGGQSDHETDVKYHNGINSNYTNGAYGGHDDTKEYLRPGSKNGKLFDNPRIHDAFMGTGDYSNLVLPEGKFGLGFRRFEAGNESLTSFGHSGVGGSTGFCDVHNNFSVAVTVNKMSYGGVTRSIIQLICSELGIPIPQEFASQGTRGPDMMMNLG